MTSLRTFTLIAGIAAAAAAAAPAPAALADSPTVVRYSFVLAPGGSKALKLPVVGYPIDMLVSLSAENNGTQTPSELARAVVNEDARSRQLTWIGTSSDGTTAAGTTLDSTQIAIIGPAPGNLVISAQAPTGDAGLGKLLFTQSAGQTAINLHYIVTLIY